jgi:hypothetical protein
MRRTALPATLVLGLAAFALPPLALSTAAGAETVAHDLGVSGAGVGMYPAFDPDTERYAVTTTGQTQGTVTVQASTSDPDGTVRVNGRPVTGGQATVTGLEEGDEISVLVEDAGGVTARSLVYLPAGFPRLEATVSQPGVAPGVVGLSLTQWNTPAPSFEAAVDRNGVPVYVRTSPGAMDLKRQPNGSYSVGRDSGWPNARVVELDERFEEVASYRTVGLENTDLHDAVLLPGGNRILMAYEPNPDTDRTDAVIQEVTADGEVVFEWSSAEHSDLSVFAGGDGKDYAHINSVQLTADGNYLASFRHFSAVLKIARTDHDGFEEGDIMWRLGGRFSDFEFVDDPFPGGPCAQHTAYELANGNVLIYDNGSGGFGGAMCIDPEDRTGPPVARTSTRVTEYALDEAAGTATLVWQWAPQGRYAFFAGSSERQPNGNTLTGWAAQRTSVATEVSPSGEVLWQLRDEAAAAPSGPFYSTYRASKFDAPDAIDPEVTVAAPADGAVLAVGDEVALDYSCTDRGGSNLQACEGPVPSGGLLDTSTVGSHEVRVEATDGAGNSTTVTRSYRVGPAHRPDAQIRKRPRGGWVGDDVYGPAAKQSVVQQVRRPGRTATAQVRVQNDGLRADRVRVQGARSRNGFRVSYRAGAKDVTAAVVRGTYRTPRLAPGGQHTLRVEVLRTRKAAPGDRRAVKVTASSVGTPGLTDVVRTTVRAR